jgi:hypothetical protein
MAKKTIKADTFAVWGQPHRRVTAGMTAAQIKSLKAYVDAVVTNCYRIAYDNGFVDGLTKVSSTASTELRKQRERMLRS